MTPTAISASQIPDRHFASLSDSEKGYWWFVGRVEWAVRLLRPWRQRQKEIRYADVGCGTGGFARSLCTRLKISQKLLIDGQWEALSRIPKEKGTEIQALDLTSDFAFPWEPNLITCMDVLEHIEDDKTLLLRLARGLQRGGALLASVPAHPWLYSEWDRGLGHYRRYRRKDLIEGVERAGLRVRTARFAWSFLIPLSPYRKWAAHKQERLEFPKVPGVLNRLLITLSRLESHLPEGVAPPFGTSLFLLAEKP